MRSAGQTVQIIRCNGRGITMNRATTLELLERATAPDVERVLQGIDTLADVIDAVDGLTGQYETTLELFELPLESADVTAPMLRQADEVTCDLARIVRAIGSHVDWQTRDALDTIRQYVEQTT